MVIHFHPSAGAANPVSNLIELASFDASDYAPMIAQPLLMIAGSRSEGLYLTLGIYEEAVHAASRSLHLIEGASHIETYYVPEYVDEAVFVLKESFMMWVSQNLRTGSIDLCLPFWRLRGHARESIKTKASGHFFPDAESSHRLLIHLISTFSSSSFGSTHERSR